MSHAPIILDSIQKDVFQMSTSASLNPNFVKSKCGMNLTCYEDRSYAKEWETQIADKISNIYFWKQQLSRTLSNHKKDVPNFVLKFGSATGTYVAIEETTLFLINDQNNPYIRFLF